MKTKFVASVAVLATMLVSTSVFAQQTPPPPAAQPQPGVQAQATTNTGMGLPGPQAAAVAGDSDHDMMVGSFALGYMGRREVPVGSATGIFTPSQRTLAPVIGARYWISPLLGIDAGVGFSVLGDGTHKVEITGAQTTEQDLAPVTAFLVHAGVPLALANTGHFSFQVVPEVNVGFATQKVDDQATQIETTNTGLAFDIGARGGAEIHFGFMGIPQLSLQGSVGLLYRLERFQTEQQSPGATTTVTTTTSNLTTTVYDNPWNIFQSNVAALYYF